MKLRTSISFIEPLEARIAPAFCAVVDLPESNGSDGFEIVGFPVARSGSVAVSNAGDVNGDGLGDLLLSKVFYAGFNSYRGEAYVLFGKAGGFGATADLSPLDGTNGFRLLSSKLGPGGRSFFGVALSSAGDVNGDGFGDIIIASPEFDDVGYVVFGKAGGFAASIDCGQLNGSDGFAIVDDQPDDFASEKPNVSSAGDVNADGFDDVIMGGDKGAFVLLGKPGGFTPTVTRSSLNGANGFELNNSGRIQSLSSAGDVNGDGFSDMIIGAVKTYVVFGKKGSFTGGVDVTALDGANGFTLTSAASDNGFGTSVSVAGDVNDDGFADVIVGAPNADTNVIDSGASYVVFGKESGFPPELATSQLDGSNGFRLSGVAASDHAGTSVSEAGDLNGDGFDDVVVGAPDAGLTRTDSGAVYAVFGKAGGFSADVSLAGLDGTHGFTAIGREGDRAGSSVSAAGDVNGDGVADLLLNFRKFTQPIYATPGAFVILGNGPGGPPAIHIDDARVAETDSGMTQASFTVHLSEASTEPVTVQYATREGTARANRDYLSVELSALTFAPGEVSKTISVDVVGDVNFEADEYFYLDLSAPGHGTLCDPEAGGFVINDDPAPAIFVDDVRAFEGSAVNFTLRLSAASSMPVTVQYGTANGTAIAPEDYSALGLTPLTFDPGEVTREVGIVLNEDAFNEPDETFSLNLSNPTGATIADGTGIGTILDNFARLPVQLSPSGRKATFTDVDGDLVKVKSDRGVLTQDNFVVFTSGQGGQLQMLDLARDTAFARATISVLATLPEGGRGDGFIDLGYFNATGVDLKAVIIAGDLGQIDAGDGDGSRPALKSLTVDSLGAHRLETQGSGGSLQSDLDGDLLSLSVRNDVNGATLAVLGRLGSVAIGGDLGFATITARGELLPGSAAAAQAIGSIAVQGDVFSSQLLAGYATAASAVNPDAGIGAVFVRGGWNASDLVAGVADITGDGFGRNDALITGGVASIIARIASVKINGAAVGAAASGDQFGITAENIGKAKISGAALALTAGPDDALLDPMNDDFRIVDFA